MKHFEMQRERTFIREQKSFNWAATELPLPQGFNRFQPPPINTKFLNNNGIKVGEFLIKKLNF